MTVDAKNALLQIDTKNPRWRNTQLPRVQMLAFQRLFQGNSAMPYEVAELVDRSALIVELTWQIQDS